MRSCVSTTNIIPVMHKLMMDIFLVDSCGSLAIARTVLTGDLNAQSDTTCTSVQFSFQDLG